MNTIDVQRRLVALGYDPGPVDGKMGPKTRDAIRQFQRMHGLMATGIVGPKTADALEPPMIPQRIERPEPKDIWPRQKEVERFYGPVGQNQTTLKLPFAMRLAWEPKTIIRQFSIHEKVHDSAMRCFNRIADAYDGHERTTLGLDLFGGCLNVRRMRGGSAYSMHAWGIAIDFDPARNQLRWGADRARLAKPDCNAFWRIWEDEGWVSLGRARNFDWMHVQAARL